MMIRLTSYTMLSVALLTFGCADDSDDLASPNDTLLEEQQQTIDRYLDEQSITTQQNEAGIHYQIITENPDGESPEPGSIVDLYYRIEELEGGTIAVRDSSARDSPLTYTFGNGTMLLPIRLDQLVNLMRVGETYEFYLPSSWAYLDYSSPNLVSSNAIVKARIQLAATLTTEEQAEREDHRIRAYLQEQSFASVDSLASGVYYIPIQPGDTTVPVDLDSEVQVRYTGTLLDGTEFDSNRDGDLLEFAISNERFIEGFRVGVEQMNLGEEGVVIIPSRLAYGQSITAIPHRIVGDFVESGTAPIPPYTILRFDIEVVGVN